MGQGILSAHLPCEALTSTSFNNKTGTSVGAGGCVAAGAGPLHPAAGTGSPGQPRFLPPAFPPSLPPSLPRALCLALLFFLSFTAMTLKTFESPQLQPSQLC